MGIVLDRKTLERTLVKVPGSGGMVVGVIPQRVGGSDPPEQSPHRAVLLGPKDQVPVIGHQTERKELDRISPETFIEGAKEGFVVGVLVKDFSPGVAAVERVVDAAGLVGPFGAWHIRTKGIKSQSLTSTCHGNYPLPLFFTLISLFSS